MNELSEFMNDEIGNRTLYSVLEITGQAVSFPGIHKSEPDIYKKYIYILDSHWPFICSADDG
jgi:hypothetical protein